MTHALRKLMKSGSPLFTAKPDLVVRSGSDKGSSTMLGWSRAIKVASSMLRDPPARAGRSGAASGDRKSTRLNSSHTVISYAVFCLKKKKKRIHKKMQIRYRKNKLHSDAYTNTGTMHATIDDKIDAELSHNTQQVSIHAARI